VRARSCSQLQHASLLLSLLFLLFPNLSMHVLAFSFFTSTPPPPPSPRSEPMPDEFYGFLENCGICGIRVKFNA